MEGDLSLSQSLGGLRIANPDYAHDSEDQPPSPTQSQENPSPRVSLSVTPAEDGHRLDPSRDPGDTASVRSYRSERTAGRTANRSSVAYLPDSAPPSAGQGVPRSVTTNFGPSYANGSSSGAATRERNNYRIRTDSSASSEMSRSDSRGGSMAYQAGVPSRDNSHSERTYKKSQFPSGNGPHPPRSAPGPVLPGSPYALENGPPPSSEEWQERGAAVGVRQEVDASGRTVTRYIKKGVRDFSFGQTLGEGSYSTVVLAQDRQNHKEYAIKILDKRHIIKEKKVKYVNIEKDTLNRLNDHPGIVRLYYTFQDERSLYFVIDYCPGGELLSVLKRVGTFDEECTRFYGAQILDAIDYMHKRGVIHRDLKPENILLDAQMHTKITDFGTAKLFGEPKKTEEKSGDMPPIGAGEIPAEERANSFVGTAEYVSPELLTDKNACRASDLWAFGCIIFQLLAGRPPFKAANEYLTFQKIVQLDYEFPTGFPAVARDLVERLLVLDPARRLPIEHIKNHEFFQGVTWGRGLWKQQAPRLKPYVPPPREPIKLNGGDNDSYPPNISGAPSNGGSRAYPRVITELPPPSQLDIEWSPVLTRNNERILKLGNLTVTTSPASHSPTSRNGNEGETSRKFSRFFGGSTTKKRQRLVLVTSAARIIFAAAGGEDKRSKAEINLLAPGTHYRNTGDAKQSTSWIVDTREKRYTFEEPKNGPNSPSTLAQDWLDTLDRAKDFAHSQRNQGYSGDEASAFSSHANTLDHSAEFQESAPAPSAGRTTLHKPQGDNDSVKAKKRFSRRQSKNGLSAVF